jgi:hypothetical protein
MGTAVPVDITSGFIVRVAHKLGGYHSSSDVTGISGVASLNEAGRFGAQISPDDWIAPGFVSCSLTGCGSGMWSLMVLTRIPGAMIRESADLSVADTHLGRGDSTDRHRALHSSDKAIPQTSASVPGIELHHRFHLIAPPQSHTRFPAAGLHQ